jgi:hypothetical protein
MLTQFSTGNKVQDPAASMLDGIHPADMCVSSFWQIRPVFHKVNVYLTSKGIHMGSLPFAC